MRGAVVDASPGQGCRFAAACVPKAAQHERHVLEPRCVPSLCFGCGGLDCGRLDMTNGICGGEGAREGGAVLGAVASCGGVADDVEAGGGKMIREWLVSVWSDW